MINHKCYHVQREQTLNIDCKTSAFHQDTKLVNMSAKQVQPCSQGSLLPGPMEREPGNEVEAREGPAR